MEGEGEGLAGDPQCAGLVYAYDGAVVCRLTVVLGDPGSSQSATFPYIMFPSVSQLAEILRSARWQRLTALLTDSQLTFSLPHREAEKHQPTRLVALLGFTV